MYNEYYSFSEKPFEATADPKFIYFSSNHRDALITLLSGIKNRKAFISLTGEAGTGKKALLHFLLGRLDEKVKAAFITHPSVGFKDLLTDLTAELGLKVEETSKELLLSQLNGYLERLDGGKTLLVIIDEAQNLSGEVMVELARLREMIPKTGNRLQIIFVGSPEFEDNLNSPELRFLNQRIGKCRLRTLTEEESRRYIDHRLKLVGSCISEVFTPNAVSTILIRAKGIPRMINELCDHALLIGYRLSRIKIDAEIVGEAINERENPIPQKSIPAKIVPTSLKGSHWRFPMTNLSPRRISLVLLCFLCAMGVLILIGGSPQRKPIKTGNIESIKKERMEALLEVIVVEQGQTLSSLSQKYYRTSNPTLFDLILDFNPEITDPGLIQVNQKIKIPKITKEWLMRPSLGRAHRIHVGTFWTPDFVRPYKNEPALKGKEIEVLPWKASPRDTWYRVVVGNFNNKDEALRVIDLLQAKKLLPLFGDIPKIE